MRRTLKLAVLVGLLVHGVAPARAHHSPSLFDQGRDLTLEGVIVKVDWANPHVYIHIEVKNERDDAAVWVIEAQSPRVMSLFGWSSTSLVVGDRVTVAASPLRDGDRRLVVLGRSVVTQDRTILRIPWQQGEIREALRSESSGPR
jgi:hypothetical protein